MPAAAAAAAVLAVTTVGVTEVMSMRAAMAPVPEILNTITRVMAQEAELTSLRMKSYNTTVTMAGLLVIAR